MTFFFNFRFYDYPLGLTTASVICYSFCSVIINITVAHIKYKIIINYLSVDFMHFYTFNWPRTYWSFFLWRIYYFKILLSARRWEISDKDERHLKDHLHAHSEDKVSSVVTLGHYPMRPTLDHNISNETFLIKVSNAWSYIHHYSLVDFIYLHFHSPEATSNTTEFYIIFYTCN